MVLDALRGYVQLASGLTEVNRQKAVAEAKALLAQRGAFEQILSEQARGFADDVGRQVQHLADDLIATSKANRALLTALVRAEVERVVATLGLASSEDVDTLRRRVDRIEHGGAAPKSSSKKAAAKKSAAKKATTKKSSATKVAGTKPTATKKAP